MARLARVVVPGLPYHVTQRGNGGQKVFLTEDDYRFYRDALAALRYIALNPVRAGLVPEAVGWR